MKLFAQITAPEAGYKSNSEMVKALIEKNGAEHLYEVECVDIGRSHTDVYLIGDKRVFNSVNFSFFLSEKEGQVKEYCVFIDDLRLKNICHNY